MRKLFFPFPTLIYFNLFQTIKLYLFVWNQELTQWWDFCFRKVYRNKLSILNPRSTQHLRIKLKKIIFKSKKNKKKKKKRELELKSHFQKIKWLLFFLCFNFNPFIFNFLQTPKLNFFFLKSNTNLMPEYFSNIM